MKILIVILFALVGISCASAQAANDYESRQDQRITHLEQQLSAMERSAKSLPNIAENTGGAAFLFGAFCALWAQNTGRSAWLWFFLGLFFSIITVIFLLIKNSNDRFDKQQRDRFKHGRA